MKKFEILVGIDEADKEHEIAVIGADGALLEDGVRFPHSAAGMVRMIECLDRHSGGDRASVAVALERPHGPVADCLLEHGVALFYVNPKQLDRFRDRHSASGAKDDRLDAYVLADGLRTDQKLYRKVKAGDPLVLQIRGLSRVRKEIQEDQVQLANKLRAELHRYFPQVFELSNGVNELWVWDVLDVAMTPARARTLRPAKVRKILRANRIRRVSADQVLQTLRAPAITVNASVIEAATTHINFLIPRLRLAHQQLQASERKLNALVERFDAHQQEEDEAPTGEKKKHRDVEILLSFPGIGKIITATMLGEAREDLANRDYSGIRLLSGVAPVTKRSGKTTRVHRRYARNLHLADAVFHWARVAAQRDSHARDLYLAIRARGHNHARALRGLADRLLKILIAALAQGELYDPTRVRRVTTIEA